MEESSVILVLKVFVDLKRIIEDSVSFCLQQYWSSEKNGSVYLHCSEMLFKVGENTPQ